MAEIETIIDREQELTVHTVRGELAASELLEAVTAYYAGPEVTRNLLWDFRAAGFNSATPTQIKEITHAVHQLEPRRSGGRSALVFGSPAAYGIGRMFELTSEVMGASVEHRSFYDLASALAWLSAA